MCDFLANIFNKYISCILCIDIEKNINEEDYNSIYSKKNSIEDDYVFIEKNN
jgi:hypothetical protein